jgi:hypothetical protein
MGSSLEEGIGGLRSRRSVSYITEDREVSCGVSGTWGSSLLGGLAPLCQSGLAGLFSTA